MKQYSALLIPKTLAAFVVLIASQNLFANEAPVYESMRGVRIGPVFLTPEQRRWLDSRRHESDQSPSNSTSENETSDQVKRKTTPAGYIINSRGERRQWQGNTFKAASATTVSSTRFPGNVKIVRHRSAVDSTKHDSDDGDETGD